MSAVSRIYRTFPLPFIPHIIFATSSSAARNCLAKSFRFQPDDRNISRNNTFPLRHRRYTRHGPPIAECEVRIEYSVSGLRATGLYPNLTCCTSKDFAILRRQVRNILIESESPFDMAETLEICQKKVRYPGGALSSDR